MNISYTYKCYYEEFDDVGSFNNTVVIHNCNNKDKQVLIKNVYIYPVKNSKYNCEGTFQFDSNVNKDSILTLMKSCYNLETMYTSLRTLNKETNMFINDDTEYFTV